MYHLIPDPGVFYNALRNIDIDFFTGVPDSLLKGRKLHKTFNFIRH
jgi:hypothetical protein